MLIFYIECDQKLLRRNLEELRNCTRDRLNGSYDVIFHSFCRIIRNQFHRLDRENCHSVAYYSHVILKPVKQLHYRRGQAHRVPGV
jgi:hypothetical protein